MCVCVGGGYVRECVCVCERERESMCVCVLFPHLDLTPDKCGKKALDVHAVCSDSSYYIPRWQFFADWLGQLIKNVSLFLTSVWQPVCHPLACIVLSE